MRSTRREHTYGPIVLELERAHHWRLVPAAPKELRSLMSVFLERRALHHVVAYVIAATMQKISLSIVNKGPFWMSISRGVSMFRSSRSLIMLCIISQLPSFYGNFRKRSCRRRPGIDLQSPGERNSWHACIPAITNKETVPATQKPA
jgi:hypothetical protein